MTEGLTLSNVLFYLIALGTLVSAGAVAFSRNIVYSAFGLFGTLLGVAAIYAYLSADFIAIVQLLVYVGGILVLILFAIMLTNRIEDVRCSNKPVGVASGIAGLIGLLLVILPAVMRSRWAGGEIAGEPTTAALGNAFLKDYLLPFEIASLVLLAALVGAIIMVRREARKEPATGGKQGGGA